MIAINAATLFREIEEKIPLSLALENDRVGYTGTKKPGEIEVERILVMMDYISPGPEETVYGDYDLLILHHPPQTKPEIPAYVIHSNWDILTGGACDALADRLKIDTTGFLDLERGLGRTGTFAGEQVLLPEFCGFVKERLGLDHIRVVNFNEERETGKICLVPGFGLNPAYIKLAIRRGADTYISGDLTHPGAILARNSGLVLIDASHHATEVPGLYRLRDLISGIGVETDIADTGIPWNNYSGCGPGEIPGE